MRHYHGAWRGIALLFPFSTLVVEIQPLVPEPECRERGNAPTDKTSGTTTVCGNSIGSVK